MRFVLNYKKFAYLALICWLLASLGGVCLHLCFDGSEPTSAVYFDTLDSSHMQHNDDAMHDDANINLNQSILTQLSHFSIPLIMALVLLMPLLQIQKSSYFLFLQTYSPRNIFTLSPPLRAPPFLHA